MAFSSCCRKIDVGDRKVVNLLQSRQPPFQSFQDLFFNFLARFDEVFGSIMRGDFFQALLKTRHDQGVIRIPIVVPE